MLIVTNWQRTASIVAVALIVMISVAASRYLGVGFLGAKLYLFAAGIATLYAMQACLPHMRQRGGGAIVNFGSTTAIEGDVAFGAYAMAKEAIRGLSRVAAREWGRYGIRVNVIVPIAMSPAAEQFRTEYPERFEKQAAKVPLGRMGDPETDIGRAVVALAGGDLTYMTAQTLMLTGGA